MTNVDKEIASSDMINVNVGHGLDSMNNIQIVFTAIAAFTAGSAEMTPGYHDDALCHLRKARGLAERSGLDWLVAGSPVQLGIL